MFVSSLLPLTDDPFVPVLELLLFAPFPLLSVASLLSLVADFLVGLPVPVFPLVATLPVSSVVFLVLVWAGDILADAEDEVLCVELLLLSSIPLRGRLDAILPVVDVEVDVSAVVSGLVTLLLPFEVG